MKWMGASAAGVAGLEAFENMAAALTKGENTPALIWINDHGTDVNLLSLLGNEVPGFLDLVQGHWNVIEHDSLMPTLHTQAPLQKNQAPILIVEQVPPYLVKNTSAENPLLKILQKSKAVVQLGTDACFGGLVIPSSRITKFDLLCRELKTPVIKLPGVQKNRRTTARNHSMDSQSSGRKPKRESGWSWTNPRRTSTSMT